VFGGPAWTWDSRRCQYYLHNFLTEQPDLNFHNPEVVEATLATARFWLDRGVDGFRLDALNFTMHDPKLRDNPPVTDDRPRNRPFDFQQRIYNQSHKGIPALLEKLQAVVDSYGDRFTVAEVGGDDADKEMKLFTHGAKRLNSAYGFTYLYAPDLTAQVVRDAIGEWPGKGDEGWPSWAFSNHDAPRHVTRWGEGRERDRLARLTMLLLLSLRGNVFIYQGEELGLPQAHVPYERLVDPEAIANWPLTLGRDGARTPMPWTDKAPWGNFSTVEPWLPVDPEHLPLSVAKEEDELYSMLHWTREMVALRKGNPALRHGTVRILDKESDVLVFERIEGDQHVRCIFNLTDTALPWPKGKRPEGEVLASVGLQEAGLPALSGAIIRIS
jgi:alpha-glucosidase